MTDEDAPEVSSEESTTLALATVAFKDIESGLMVLDKSGEIVLWNSWMSRSSGVSNAEAIGRPLDEVFPSIAGGRVWRAIQGALKHGMPTLLSHTLNRSPFPLYRSFRHTEEELMRQMVVIKPTKLASIERHCLIQVFDVTSAVVREEMLRKQTVDLKEAQDQLVAAAKEKELREIQLEKEKTEVQMAGGFAHEMRNALAGANLLLMGALGKDGNNSEGDLCQRNRWLIRDVFVVLEKESGISLEGRNAIVEGLRRMNRNQKGLSQVLHNVHYATERALSITKQIMEYSKIGHANPGEETVNMNALFFSVLHEQQVDFNHEGIKTHLEVPDDLNVRAENFHIYSIVQNLVVNARDAVVERGDGENKEIVVRADGDSDGWWLEVQDSGVGIPEEAKTKVFAAFYSTKPETGTGLGLGMVEKLASLYNGTISFESVVGEGTTFRLDFNNTVTEES